MNWKKHYENRVNNPESFKKFTAKYNQFINAINIYLSDYYNKYNIKSDIMELGCGIGGITKAVVSSNPNAFNMAYLFDIDSEMCELAKKNNSSDNISIQNKDLFKVLEDLFLFPMQTELIITHGVLEHFSDEQLNIIASDLDYTANIHYVPLNKYKTQSFGDERLLPKEFWLDIFKPSNYKVFNNGYDLMFGNYLVDGNNRTY